MNLRAMAEAYRLPAPNAVPAKWRVCAALTALALGLGLWPHALDLLRLERASVFSGQLWRMLTGHLVHLNTPHLMMNLLALFLLCELLWGDLDWRHGVGLMLCAAFGTSFALLAWHPELAWYAGLSGVLHGLWAGCALRGVRAAAQGHRPEGDWRVRWPMPRRIGAIALALLGLKLVLEFYFGPSERTAQAIGGQVIAVSHAYGALSGIVYMFARRGLIRFKRAAAARFRLK